MGMDELFCLFACLFFVFVFVSYHIGIVLCEALETFCFVSF